MQINLPQPVSQKVTQTISNEHSSSLGIGNDVAPSSTSLKIGNEYDVTNMSLDGLSNMVMGMYESGEMSRDDLMQFSMQRHTMELLNYVPKDTKVNMISTFQNFVDMMHDRPESVGVEYLEHSLDILRGIDARSKASIPQSV